MARLKLVLLAGQLLSKYWINYIVRNDVVHNLFTFFLNITLRTINRD